MRTKLFFLLFAVLCAAFCQRGEKSGLPPYDAARPAQSDRKPNGGMLRFTLDGKLMHDTFFEAQFTPRGEVFQFDNLQMYNYNFGSDKFPRLLISIDHTASDLEQWSGLTAPMDLMAFTPAAGKKPFSARGEIKIKSADEHNIEGTFSGELVHPQSGRTFPMRGEFRAVVKLNI
jgi:hypothetical protein